MNKSNLIKKIVLCSLVIFYNIVSFFWCYVLIKSLIFEFSTVKIGLNGIYSIVGADIPTLIYKMSNDIGVVFSILFILLGVATALLLTVLIFKKQTNYKLSILLCIFSMLTLIAFMLIPAQTYVVSLYTLVRRLSFLKYIQITYIALSLVIIVKNILFAIKMRDKRQ